MNLFFFIEARVPKINSDYYLPDMFGMKIMARYLEVFDNVYIVCRINAYHDIAKLRGYKKLCDPRVKIIDLPLYHTPFEYIKSKRLIKSIITNCSKVPNSAFLCRVPGQIGTIAASILKSNGSPYGVEVVGDPWESLSPRAFKHKFSPIVRIVGTYNLKKTVRNAAIALYVTDYVLQNKYPVKKGVFSINASNVELLKENILPSCPTSLNMAHKDSLNIMSIGTLEQLYKAPDVVLRALSILKKKGVRFRFTWYGDGLYRQPMIELSKQLGICDYVDFVGSVSHDKIMEVLKSCDLLIHASRAEGLPRAVIEAMASAIPVIGTRVAGIPELLLPEAIVPINNPEAVCEAVEKFISDEGFALIHAKHNLERSRDFEKSLLAKRRKEFYMRLFSLSKAY